MDEEDYNKIVESRDGKPHLHAMVLIGAYHQADQDRYWFLLQNTHKNAYFKLVDGEYLASCCASLAFPIPGTDMSLKEDYNTVDGEYSEAAFDLDECMASFEPYHFGKEGLVFHA